MAEMGSVGQCGLASGGYRVDSKACRISTKWEQRVSICWGEVTIHFGRINRV